jgi:hypothetical protein
MCPYHEEIEDPPKLVVLRIFHFGERLESLVGGQLDGLAREQQPRATLGEREPSVDTVAADDDPTERVVLGLEPRRELKNARKVDQDVVRAAVVPGAVILIDYVLEDEEVLREQARLVLVARCAAFRCFMDFDVDQQMLDKDRKEPIVWKVSIIYV